MSHVGGDVFTSGNPARPVVPTSNSTAVLEGVYEGLVLESPLVSIDQSLINDYANMFGDKNRIHLDLQFARSCGLKSTIAHGALVFSRVSGLAHDFDCLKDIGVQFREVDLKFKRPVYAGDQVALRLKIAEVKELKRGLVRIMAEATIFNQDRDTVHEYEWHGFFNRLRAVLAT